MGDSVVEVGNALHGFFQVVNLYCRVSLFLKAAGFY